MPNARENVVLRTPIHGGNASLLGLDWYLSTRQLAVMQTQIQRHAPPEMRLPKANGPCNLAAKCSHGRFPPVNVSSIFSAPRVSGDRIFR